jgi:hypothetical protein
MTEGEWWTATEPDRLIHWLFFDCLAADRKLRLFAVACARRVEHLVEDAGIRELLDLAEESAEGWQSAGPLQSAHEEALRKSGRLAAGHPSYHPADAARECAIRAASWADGTEWRWYRDWAWYEQEDDAPYPSWVTRWAANAVGGAFGGAEDQARRDRESLAQLRLLHDIFGPLPFRDITVRPSWLTAEVRLLAQGIYDAKAFDRMPILADALQEAGCASDEVLSHCRAAGWEHVRGCWVIDLLLGRPWKEPGTSTGG